MFCKFFNKLLTVTLLAIAFCSSCRKDEPINTDSGAQINFSATTIYFDTVFTSVGSTTRRFKIYNNNSKKIVLSRISLLHGNGSLFRVNVDGTPGKNLTNIEIGPKDSLFVFVEVTINPSPGSTPFVVSDSIMFSWNGNTHAVGLVAWGQDAYYIRANAYARNLPIKIVGRMGHDTTWTKKKPIVVYGYAVVDSACTLTIEAGTHIYFHPGAGLWVYRYGSLKVRGTQTDTVVFQGDRLDYAYRDIPGQWDRIWINEGGPTDSASINYAIIKNGFIGLQTEALTAQTTTALKLSNTIIKNMTGLGILARFYNISGYNDVVANCGQYCMLIQYGGTYDFKQCTFADYYLYANRQTPLLAMNNYSSVQTFPLNANFGNSIFYGSLDNEIGFDPSSTGTFAYAFNHCLLKIDPTVNTATSNYPGTLTNVSVPVFKDPTNSDYTLADGSPAIGAGDSSISSISPYDFDIRHKSRLNSSDLGAYEK